jgi:hypothetical protein
MGGPAFASVGGGSIGALTSAACATTAARMTAPDANTLLALNMVSGSPSVHSARESLQSIAALGFGIPRGPSPMDQPNCAPESSSQLEKAESFLRP